MKNSEKKYKHLTYEDRLEIQECLAKGMTFKDIGKRIDKHQTTVSKEVKLHTVTHANSFCKTEEICPRLKKRLLFAMDATRKAVVVARIFDICMRKSVLTLNIEKH